MSQDTLKNASSSEEAVKKLVENPKLVEKVAEQAERKVRRGGSKLRAVRTDLFTMIRMLRAWARGQYKGVGFSSLIVIVGAVLYFINPIDAVADFLPMIGFTDDIAVIAFALSKLKGEFDRFEEWEQNVDVNPS